MAVATQTHRVLIVDDQESIRRALRSLLRSDPVFELCGEAANGREAVEKALELDPEVVLMDVSMPELDGLEATRRIRKVLPETEVLIFTQHEPAQAARAAKEAGARGFLAKSKASHDLVPALTAVCEHRPFFPEPSASPKDVH
ncbi:MAG TPA: response regulator transcription factor [Terriglobales bacterium]|jgi:DNA-binding NarL/FixJ family response regulator